MIEFGTIVLVPFPFTDLTSTKVRPAVIVSREAGDDVIVCFITSKIDSGNPATFVLESNATTGLKVRSAIRFDKIATLHMRVILGELGKADTVMLRKYKERFFGVFGF